MFFNKIPPAANFRYLEGQQPLLQQPASGYKHELDDLSGGVYRITVQSERWAQKSHAVLDTKQFGNADHGCECKFYPDHGLELSHDGVRLLESSPQRAFGVLGQKWIMSFRYDAAMRFYGLGEKNTGFEKTGHICKFWNTDVFADFGFLRSEHAETDPLYASFPYVLIKQPKGCVGILVNNPYPVFMNLGAEENIANLQDANELEPKNILIGSYNGTPEVYFIIGSDARDVTRKMQRLCGITPLPPLWALGNHQCRFGYRDLADMEELDAKFDEHEIPCDGLWLDIDYMDGFRVFTVNDGFENYEERIAKLQQKGRKIVPILDPGVKNDEGFPVFQSGLDEDLYCKTCEGDIYSGFVWPGRTAFPDFSLERARNWWAWHVNAFTEKFGFDGYWIDMNDPSTGSSELEDMLFNEGKDDHNSYHNQYALGMQQATVEGLAMARPGERPFVISRSGFISSQRYSAIWTGDNWSNYKHLREGIAMSLNLSLSGVPFNGPDVPGFAGEASPELAVDWHKAGFLFPFFRNHSANMFPKQEPWQFEEQCREVMAHYIRLRYKLLPYLYNCFFDHRETADPILQTLFYRSPDDKNADMIGDQFMVGNSIMQAPIVEEGSSHREIYLPAGVWFSASDGSWINGKKKLQFTTDISSTALYFNESSILPTLPGERKTIDKQLDEIEMHIFIQEGSDSVAQIRYRFDDGISIPEGVPNFVSITARVLGAELQIAVDEINSEKPLALRFVTYASFDSISISSLATQIELVQHEHTQRWTGADLPASISNQVHLVPTGELSVATELETLNA